jgi:hypothetical protein
MLQPLAAQLTTSSGQQAAYQLVNLTDETPDYLPEGRAGEAHWHVAGNYLEIRIDGTISGRMQWDNNYAPPANSNFNFHYEAFIYYPPGHPTGREGCYFFKDLVEFPAGLFPSAPPDYFSQSVLKSGNDLGFFVGSVVHHADESIPFIVNINNPQSFDVLPSPDPSWPLPDGTFSAGFSINNFGDVLVKYGCSDSGGGIYQSSNGHGYMFNYFDSSPPKRVEYPGTQTPIHFGGGGIMRGALNGAPQFVEIDDSTGGVFRIGFDSNLESNLLEEGQFVEMIKLAIGGISESGSVAGTMNLAVQVPYRRNQTRTEWRQVPCIYSDPNGLVPLCDENGEAVDINSADDVVGWLENSNPTHNEWTSGTRFLYHKGFGNQSAEFLMLEGDVVSAAVNLVEDLEFWHESDNAGNFSLSDRIDVDGDGVEDYPMITAWAKRVLADGAKDKRWYLLKPVIVPLSNPIVYSSADTPLSIPDNDSNGRTSIIEVQHGQAVDITSLTITLDISHPRPSDLEVYVVGPSGGPTVQLFNYSGDNVVPDFNGNNSQGDWTLTVVDTRTRKEGTLNNWSITVDY